MCSLFYILCISYYLVPFSYYTNKSFSLIENPVFIYIYFVFCYILFLLLYLWLQNNNVARYSRRWIPRSRKSSSPIYRAITRGARRICPEILNFCGTRLAQRIDIVSRHPLRVILQRIFCLWQPLVGTDKHNVREIDQQLPNISGNYVAFAMITQALSVSVF